MSQCILNSEHTHQRCGSALHILIYFSSPPPNPRQPTSVHGSRLQIRVRHPRRLPKQDIKVQIRDTANRNPILIISETLPPLPGYKNHSNSTYRRISHFVLFPGTNTLIHMRTHTPTQAWNHVKIALICIHIHMHRGINTHCSSILALCYIINMGTKGEITGEGET